MRTREMETVLAVGPGPVTLEEGTEFQYLAARICRCLRGRGFRVVVLEDNPATLMDGEAGEADLFLEPPLPGMVARVARECGASSLWLGTAGRRGWSLARDLAVGGWLEREGLRIADLPDQVLWACGDRSLLREMLEEAGIPNPAFRSAGSLREAQEAAASLGFPLVVRPHFSRGGWGAGIAFNREELPALLLEACRRSPGGEVLVEEYLGGWRKYLVCVLRDGWGASDVAGIAQQLEPLPLHEEDAALVAPPLPAGELAYALEEISRRTAEMLGVVGLLEVKMAVSPGCERVCVLDVHAGPGRLTPLLEVARGTDLVARHVGLVCGERLDGKAATTEYRHVILSLPRLFYPEGRRGEGPVPLGCRAVGRVLLGGRDPGEVASAARDLEEEGGLELPSSTWKFLEDALQGAPCVPPGGRGTTTGEAREDVRSPHREEGGFPLWLAGTPHGFRGEGMVFLGPGTRRPGSGHELHFSLYRALRAFRERGGYAAALVEDAGFALLLAEEADAVFLGPLSRRGLRDVLEKTGIRRVCPHFGGKEAFAVARGAEGRGTEMEFIGGWREGEDIPILLRRMRSSGIPLVSFACGREEARDFLLSCRFPVQLSLFRGPREVFRCICYGADEARGYLEECPEALPLLRELREDSMEVVVEAVVQGGRLCRFLAWERLQATGGEAGEGPAVFPPLHLTSQQNERLSKVVEEAAALTGWSGNLSLRLVVEEGEVRLWDLCPGASEQVPFITRASSLDLPETGLGALLDEAKPAPHVEAGWSAVRYPVVPLGVVASEDLLIHSSRLHTGEVVGVGESPGQALARILWSLGMCPRPGGKALLSVANREKRRAVLLGRELCEAGFALVATHGTARALRAAGMEVEEVCKLREGRPNVLDLLRNGEVQLVVNIPRGRHPHSDGFYIREDAARHGIPCITDMETALALVRGMRITEESDRPVRPLGRRVAGALAGRGG